MLHRETTGEVALALYATVVAAIYVKAPICKHTIVVTNLAPTKISRIKRRTVLL